MQKMINNEEVLFNKHLRLLQKYKKLILKSKYKNIFANYDKKLTTYSYQIVVLNPDTYIPKVVSTYSGTFDIPYGSKIKNIHLGNIELYEDTLFNEAQTTINELLEIERKEV